MPLSPTRSRLSATICRISSGGCFVCRSRPKATFWPDGQGIEESGGLEEHPEFPRDLVELLLPEAA